MIKFSDIHITRRTQRIVIVVLFVLVLVFIILYLASHGRISIKAPSGTHINSLSYCSTDCSNPTITQDGDTIVPTGKYIVHIELDNNTSYVVNAQVSGFLRTTSVEAKSRKYSPSVVAASTGQYILPLANAYLTYSPDGTAYTTTSTTSSIPGSLVVAKPTGDNKVIMVEYKEQGQESISMPEGVYVYDIATNSSVEIGTVTGIQSDNIVSSANTVYGFQQNSDGGYNILTITVSGVSTTTLPESVSYAKNGETPIASISDTYYAVLSGNDYFIPQSDESDSGTSNTSTVTLYNKSFGEVKSITLGARSDISALSLSPDSKELAVVGEDTIYIYDTTSGDLLFETPAHNSTSSSILWKDNSSFIYQVGTSGIYLCDVSNKESYSIIDNTLLRITSTSSVKDNKIYLTAYPNKQGNYEHTEPDGYVVDLSHDLSDSSSISTNSILRDLPYDGMSYTIGYHFDKDANIILDVYAEAGARNSAIDEIASLGFDPGDYTILIHNYTNPFGDPIGGTK